MSAQKPALIAKMLLSRYTASYALFEALWEAGVQACFVNLGSDHPSLIEAMVKGQKERSECFPQIYTCPTEMVALSMADGWARVTQRPQAVIAHVDVGTQALGCGVHNASAGRCPVFIFAGLCPFTEDGSRPGSRTEYQHWIQDAPDQKAILSQYCRYVGDLRTGSTVKATVARALQFACSDPKGPVYVTGAREIMAEEVESHALSPLQLTAIGPSALPEAAVSTIAKALVSANRPLIITGYSGRNPACPPLLVQLADSIPGLQILDTGGSDMCFPYYHPASLGFQFSVHPSITEADMILVFHCDVPWIPSRNPPPQDALIYHVDSDPLNKMMANSHFPAHARWQADSFVALTQLKEYIEKNENLVRALKDPKFAVRREHLKREHAARLASFAELAASGADDDGQLTAHNTGRIIKTLVPSDAVFVIEAVTNAVHVADQLQISLPGCWINCGGAGLGWSGGAALGAKLALDASGKPRFVCAVVGDGAFLFSFPGSVFWVAARYGVPVLTVVLNNKGWNAPRKSLELVHPDGMAANLPSENLHISFDPSPDYSGIAKAAGGQTFRNANGPLFSAKTENVSAFRNSLAEAVQAVLSGRGAVVEAVLNNKGTNRIDDDTAHVALQSR